MELTEIRRGAPPAAPLQPQSTTTVSAGEAPPEDVVSLSSSNGNESRKEAIEEALYLAVLDEIRKSQFTSTQFENMTFNLELALGGSSFQNDVHPVTSGDTGADLDMSDSPLVPKHAVATSFFDPSASGEHSEDPRGEGNGEDEAAATQAANAVTQASDPTGEAASMFGGGTGSQIKGG